MARNPNENIEIKILPVKESYGLDADQIISIVRKDVLPKTHESYSNAKVRLVHKKEAAPDYFIVTLFHQNTYAADVVRVNLVREYGVDNVIFNYIETEDDYEDLEDEKVHAKYAESGVEMVFATSCDHISSAVDGVNKAYDYARNAGYNAIKLIGAEASVAAYRYWLKQNLRAFGNIGHGLADKTRPYCSGLALYDGNLMYTWFDSLPKGTYDKTVIYFNSCKAFQPDLGTSIIHAKPRTYISGIVNLLIGPSEDCFKCFWNKVLSKDSAYQMKPTLSNCDAQFIPGDMDIWGDEGKFYTGW